MRWEWLFEMRPPCEGERAACLAAGGASTQLVLALDTASPDFQALWQAAEQQHSVRAAVVVAALSAVLRKGRDLRAASVWRERGATLLNAVPNLSAAARAGLLIQEVLAELLGSSDLTRAKETLLLLVNATALAHSGQLRALQTAVGAAVCLMAGHLRCAETLLTEGQSPARHAKADEAPDMPTKLMMALLAVLRGRPQQAGKALTTLIESIDFDRLPDATRLIAHGHRLLALVSAGAAPETVRNAAATMLRQPLAADNVVLRSHLYYLHGLAELAAGHAEDALLYGSIGETLGEACGCGLTRRLASLLVIQAHAQLGHSANALNAAHDWLATWKPSGSRLLEAAVHIEIAALHAQAGHVDAARGAMRMALATLPADEPLPAQHRSRQWVTALHTRLLPAAEPSSTKGEQLVPLVVTTFGMLTVRIHGRLLYDRDWHGSRAKTLLKALIVLGGNKVSADRICDLVWPDAEGDKARQNLKVALSRLRRLGISKGEAPLPWVVMQHNQVSLVSALCQVDALCFRRALTAPRHISAEEFAEALGRYTDDFLAQDISEAWIGNYRDELRGLYVRASQALAQHEQIEPGNPEALRHLERAITFDPVNALSRELLARMRSAYSQANAAQQQPAI